MRLHSPLHPMLLRQADLGAGAALRVRHEFSAGGAAGQCGLQLPRRLVKQHAGHVNALAGRPIAACTLVAPLASPAPPPPSPPAIPAVAAAAGPALNAPLAPPPSITAAAG